MQILDAAYLTFIHGSSNKFYQLTLLQDGATYAVAFNYGPVGAPRGWGWKTQGVDAATARKVYDKFLREKTGEGYEAAPQPAALVYPGATGAENAEGATISPPPVSREPAPLVPRFAAEQVGDEADLDYALAHPDRVVIEQKYDGMRALMVLSPDRTIEIRNRGGQNKGRIANAPRLEQSLRILADTSGDLWLGTILDGELVGRTFNETMHLLGGAGRNETGLRFVVFDVPWLAGNDLRPLPWHARRAALEEIAKLFRAPVEMSPLLPADPDVVARIWRDGGEGVVLKDVMSPYITGDRTAWRRIKQVHTDDGVILGFEAGVRKIGSVILGQYREGALVEVCKVSGMDDDTRGALDDTWLGSVVEFAHYGRTESSYRQPHWVRARPDKAPEDCVW